MSIRWITPLLGTAPALEVLGHANDVEVIDVRDLVDKEGNRSETVRQKIEQGIASLRLEKKTIVCCDYGISRSNSVAAGILALYEGINFEQAVRKVQKATGEREIKLEPLEAVRQALGGATEKASCTDSRRRIMVTGSSGFIGRALLPELQDEFHVVAPTRSEIDLESGSTQLGLLAAEQNVDCIVHLANPRVYTSNKAFGVTMSMLRNVIDVCLSRNIRLVYLSGWEVYSAYRGEIIADESVPLHAKGPYGDAKYLAEKLLEQNVRASGLRCTILRSGPVYGVGSDKPKFIYNFIEKARAGEQISTHRYSNGKPALDLMHVDDLVQAIAKTVRKDIVGDFNLGTGILTETYEIAAHLVTLIGSSSKISSVLVDSFVASVAMDYEKALTQLGWTPTISLESGLESLI